MPATSKVQDLEEALKWLREGRTYGWIVDEYQRRYGIKTTAWMWSVVRLRHGIEPRIVRDRELIPWKVEPRHRHGHAIAMLRAEARRRAGATLTCKTARDLDNWLAARERGDTVVHYDRESGWSYVERRPEVDRGLIRVPGSGVRPGSGLEVEVFVVYPDGKVVPFDPLLLT